MLSYDSHAQRAGPATDISIRTTTVGHAAVCTLAGMMHAENEEQLQRALGAALDRRPAVDLSAVRLFTSSGLNTLLVASRAAHACGAALVLLASSANVRRVLAITGIGRLFPVFPSLRLALQYRNPEGRRDKA
ncbi:STAS domain-containing protein [Kitasatospora sp. NPDC007106]|uniref:STAS domain-containing protein n=1 Tax=Kitasatospora sp. NPDC007106 TaxID=3156914 RepID=UPI0033E44282